MKKTYIFISTIKKAFGYKLFAFVLCIMSFLMMTAGLCNKKQANTSEYTVTFNSNGGSTVESIKVKAGGTITKPANPTKKGYIFVDWYSDQALTKVFDFKTPINANITLYAKWVAIQYKVMFNSNGGSPIEDQLVDSGNRAIQPPDPTLSGAIFEGWYSNQTLTEIFNFQTSITENITLYAKWTPKSGIQNLSDIIASGQIPTNFSNYDTMSQQVLMPYTAGAMISAIYISKIGWGNKNGSSWANAYPASEFKKVIDGISDASNNKIYIVLLSAGTYITQTMSMKNNVAIVGGWAMQGGWTRKTTDTTIISGGNDHRVFRNNNLNNTALLYGTTIAGGATAGNGGGMENTSSSPTLTNIIFSDNSASDGNNGGGMFNETSSPILTNVVFLNNVSSNKGGGMFNEASSPILTNVIFLNNKTLLAGGGIYNNNGSGAILTNVLFSKNEATNSEGGLGNDNSGPVVVNAIFWDNVSYQGQDSQYTAGANVKYSVVQGGTASAMIKTDNPNLNNLSRADGYFMPTISYTGTSPDNLGLYVKRSKTAPYTFYYSIDGNQWYTDPAMATIVPLPTNVIDLTATDIQGRVRNATTRPDAGVWKKE